MKNLSLLFALLFSVVVTAQETKRPETFPNTHPELLLGKTVKIIPLTGWKKKEGYINFYTNEYTTHIYKENSFRKTPPEALENRVFKITNVKDNYYKTMTLESEDGEILYAKYDKNLILDYYFEVEGGLEVPEGFYCEYLNDGVDDGKQQVHLFTKMFWSNRIVLQNNIENDKLEVQVVFSMPTTAEKGATIIFDNGEKIEQPEGILLGKLNNGSREYKKFYYTVSSDRDKKLFTENIITTVILGKEKTPTNSDYPAIESERIRGVIECALKTIEERNKQ